MFGLQVITGFGKDADDNGCSQYGQTGPDIKRDICAHIIKKGTVLQSRHLSAH